MDNEKILAIVSQIYGVERASALTERLERVLSTHSTQQIRYQRTEISEHDSILITYPDQVQENGRSPLSSLAEFCEHYLAGLFSGIHLLPFFPWSSDDGFSVINYRAVAAQYGTWVEVQRLGKSFQLMFDAVINHVSAKSKWFKEFLDGKAPYKDFFITVTGEPDLSEVIRPRAFPLLTRFETSAGEKAVWTTFSSDQIDLNFHEPDVLFEIVDILLLYINQGATLIRLDAVAYLWKEIGTSCINLPKTHAIVRLIRAILDRIAPYVILVTETNVMHTENIAYFGNGLDEAQLIYNFALPPLVLHSIQTGNSEALANWASTLTFPSERVTFLNFLASHDGIGLNALNGILFEDEIMALAKRTEAHGGMISYKTNVDGTQRPYELNVNYFDAVNDPSFQDDQEVSINRFITAHAILLAFIGVPAIYFHSMFGSRGWPEGVVLTGQNRSINRQKLQRDELETDLSNKISLRAKVFQRLSHLLRIRSANPAFSPASSQRILKNNGSVFALVRQPVNNEKVVLCLQNVSAEKQLFKISSSDGELDKTRPWYDLISEQPADGGSKSTWILMPYQSMWLTY